MDLTISLDGVLASECGRQKKPRHLDSKLILDANTFQYQIKPSQNTMIITSGVTEELSKYPNIFAHKPIRQLISLPNTEIATPFISQGTEQKILRAIYQPNRGVGRLIGWADTEQIAHAIQLAYEGEMSTLYTNDNDILKTVKELRRTDKQLKEKLMCASIQGYLERKHWDLLCGLPEEARGTIKEVIDRLYKVAA